MKGNLLPDPISLRQAISFAWTTFQSQFSLFTTILLTFFGVWVILEMIVILSQQLGIMLWVAAHLAFLFVFACFELGFLQICLTLSSGRVPSYASLFKPSASVPLFMIGQIGYFFMVTAGLALFLIPGLYLATRYSLFGFSFAQDQVSLRSSFRQSAILSTGKQAFLLKVLVLLFLFNLLGASLLGLGLFVSIPISVLALTDCYRQLRASGLSV
jgi:hypothetical protein